MKLRHFVSFLFVFLLIFTSCAAEVDDKPDCGNHRVASGSVNPETCYTVIADEHLSEEYKVAILLALNEWAEKTNSMFAYKLSFVDMSVHPADNSMPHTMKIYVKDPGPGYVGWTSWTTGNRSAFIYVEPGVDGDTFRRIMLHELGHAFDLHFGDNTHYTGPYASVMHPSIGDASTHLCCPELTAFCNNYGCTVECTTIEHKVTQGQSISWRESSAP